ncbi:MAG: hypothetical protein LBT59_02235 [Clostridiales bacterium]|jgi:hypothetical protein|nr:hypothetical protein [Clostridiales bacterium]
MRLTYDGVDKELGNVDAEVAKRLQVPVAIGEIVDKEDLVGLDEVRLEMIERCTKKAKDWAVERASFTAGGKVVLEGTSEVETIIGRIQYESYKVIDILGKVRYSYKKYHSGLIKTSAFLYNLCSVATNASFRDTAYIMNIYRSESDKLPVSTAHSAVNDIGDSAEEAKFRLARQILKSYAIPASNIGSDKPEVIESEGVELEPLVDEAIEKSLLAEPSNNIDEMPKPQWMNDVQAEVEEAISHVSVAPTVDKKASLFIYIDEVLIDGQADTRSEETEKSRRKYSAETVIHITKDDWTYVVCGKNFDRAMDMLVAFVWSNGLNIPVSQGVEIYAEDPAQLKSFATHSFDSQATLLVDWAQMKNKVNEFLSSGLKRCKPRKDLLIRLMPLIWHGQTEDACKLLARIPDKFIKNVDHIVGLINYLSKQSPYIPDYSVRKANGEGYPLSTDDGEKDAPISKRKKGGMSWSKTGSASLAAVSALLINQELEGYLVNGKVTLDMPGKKV